MMFAIQVGRSRTATEKCIEASVTGVEPSQSMTGKTIIDKTFRELFSPQETEHRATTDGPSTCV